MGLDPKGNALSRTFHELHDRFDCCCDYDVNHLGDYLDDLERAYLAAKEEIEIDRLLGEHPTWMRRRTFADLAQMLGTVKGFYSGRLWREWNNEQEELPKRKYTNAQLWQLWDQLGDLARTYNAMKKDKATTARQLRDGFAAWESLWEIYDIARCQDRWHYAEPPCLKLPGYERSHRDRKLFPPMDRRPTPASRRAYQLSKRRNNRRKTSSLADWQKEYNK
jgi:hypothetical protein